MEECLRFSVARSYENLAEAHALRVLRYEPRFPGNDDYWWLDQDRDLAGTVFLLHKGDRAVATARVASVAAVSPEVKELGHLPDRLAADPSVWELARVTALPSERKGLSYARLLFAWSAHWAMRNLPVRKIVAYCRATKLPGFLACGADSLEGPYDIPSRGRDYYTIAADLAVVVEHLRSLGFQHLLSATAEGRSEFSLTELHPHVQSVG